MLGKGQQYTTIPRRGGEYSGVDIYTGTRSVEVYIYVGLFTNPEGDSCFSIITKLAIVRVTGANQNARKLLFTDLVNTNIGKSINGTKTVHPFILLTPLHGDTLQLVSASFNNRSPLRFINTTNMIRRTSFCMTYLSMFFYF